MADKVRVRVQWATTAKEQLRKQPLKVRQGLLAKADELIESGDPRKVHKPLVGPLAGYYGITYGRYRAIYSVHEERLASGEVLFLLTVRFVAAGIRKEGDKRDVYRLAEKLQKMGLLDDPDEPDSSGDQ